MPLKKTQAEKDYAKQIRRIKSFMTSASARGYTFNASAYRILYNTPKNITIASVKRLSKITPEYLYKKATYTTPEGETMSGTKGRKYEQTQAGRKAGEKRRGTKYKKTREVPVKSKASEPPHIVDNIIESIESILDKVDTGNLDAITALIEQGNDTTGEPQWLATIRDSHIALIRSVFYGQINMQGVERVAANVNANADKIHDLVWRMIYGDSKEGDFQMDLQEFASILKGNALSVYDSMILDEFGSVFDFTA